MDATRARLVLKEAARRFGVPTPVSVPKASARRLRFLDELFDKQRAFIDDPSREKAALCTRRAGKTTLTASYLLKAAMESNALCLFLAITRLRAKQLIWKDVKRINAQYGLGGKENETELSLTLPNGGEVRLLGADKEKEADKKRGDKAALLVVDETQLFGNYLQAMVEDVFGPALMDVRGTLCLMGTPGVVCSGYWYESTRNETSASRAERRHGYSVHEWSVLDNPHFPHAEIAEKKAKKGWADDNPTYLREYRGRWVSDAGALFYRYDEARNGFDGELPPGEWQFGLGWDLGHIDDMALVAWAWNDSSPNLYLWREWKKAGVLLRDVAEVVRKWESECGGFSFRVADTGGLGKQLVEEMIDREGIVFDAAKKKEKAAAVRTMNDDFLAGRILVKKGGLLAGELATLPKDPDDETREDPRFPNHLTDAALYSYRRAKHHLHEPDETAPEAGSPEAIARDEEFLEQQLEAEALKERDADWWEQ